MNRFISRRHALRSAVLGVTGVAGAVALAACGETQIVEVEKIVTQVVEKEVEKVVEKEVEKVVTKEVEKVVEKVVEVQAMPQAVTAIIRVAHDHTSGPRGTAMKWALEQFAKAYPHIPIKFEPQGGDYQEAFGIQMTAGTQAEVALLDAGFVNQWIQPGGFTQINEEIRKHPDWDPTRWWFSADEYTVNFFNTIPAPTNKPIEGPQFGMTYQGACTGLIFNYNMAEAKGIPEPSEGSFGLTTDFVETAMKATDAEAGEWGKWMHVHPALTWGGWVFGLSDTGTRHFRSADGLHLECFDEGGDKGYQLAIDSIHKDKYALPPADAGEFSGEFGDPFSAGKVLYGWHNGGVGGNVARIKDRFHWGLIVPPEGPRGQIPGSYIGQPHAVTNAAGNAGSTEQAVEWMLFMAGPVVQERIAIDKGSTPVLKEIYDGDVINAPPPDNYGTMHIKLMRERDDQRNWQGAHPHWWEWAAWWGAADPGFVGEETAEQSIERMVTTSDKVLQATKEDYDAYEAYIKTLPS